MFAQFVNRKIVLDHGYWNNSGIEKATGELQELKQVAGCQCPIKKLQVPTLVIGAKHDAMNL